MILVLLEAPLFSFLPLAFLLPVRIALFSKQKTENRRQKAALVFRHRLCLSRLDLPLLARGFGRVAPQRARQSLNSAGSSGVLGTDCSGGSTRLLLVGVERVFARLRQFQKKKREEENKSFQSGFACLSLTHDQSTCAGRLTGERREREMAWTEERKEQEQGETHGGRE